MLFEKKFSEIDEEDINKLVSNKEKESLILEFKRELDNNSKEIAKDISSVANTEGGLIIYGIEDEDNKAKKINWINSSENFEERLLNIINTTIVPHLTINIYPIQSKEDKSKFIYLVYIPKDLDNLYCVIKDKDNRFYVRDEVVVSRMFPREIKDRFQLILEKQKKYLENLEILKKDYCEASKIILDNHTYFNITIIPDILNEKINGINLKKLLDSQERMNLYPNSGKVRPCYKDNFIISNFYDGSLNYSNISQYYENISIIHKNGVIERWFIDKYTGGLIQSYFFIGNYLIRLLRFSIKIFNEMDYYGGFKVIVTFRAYKEISFQTSNEDQRKSLQHPFIQEEIKFNQCLNLTEEEIKNELKDFIRRLGSYAGLNIENFFRIVKLLEENSIDKICELND